MDINYELYRVFYYVARTLSFPEASKQLFISQSLSHSPSRLWRKAGSAALPPAPPEGLLTPAEKSSSTCQPSILIMRAGLASGRRHCRVRPAAHRGLRHDLRYSGPYLQEIPSEIPRYHHSCTDTSLACADLLEQGKIGSIVCNYPSLNLSSVFITQWPDSTASSAAIPVQLTCLVPLTIRSQPLPPHDPGEALYHLQIFTALPAAAGELLPSSVWPP